MIVFEVIDRFGRKIRLTDERQKHLLKKREMRNQEERLKETLISLDQVRRSVKDKNVLIFYKYYSNTPVTKKHLAVVTKTLNKEGFILSSYFTDRIKEGVEVWKKD